MSSLHDMVADLQGHMAIGQELLQLIESERLLIKKADSSSLFQIYATKKNLLPRLNQSLDKLRKHRVHWQQLGSAERAQYPEVAALLRQNQDLIMKIIVFDRENEQSLLRRGLLSAREIPPANSQRPQFVAELYRRQASSS